MSKILIRKATHSGGDSMGFLGDRFGKKPSRTESIKTSEEPRAQVVVESSSRVSEPTKPDVIPGLIELLRHGDENEREKAVVRLWNTRDPRAVPPILDAFDDSSWAVRHNAIRAFRYLHDERAVPYLLKILEAEDTDLTLRAESAETLASLHATEAIDVLRELHADASEEAITKFGGRYKRALENALKSLGGLPKVERPSDLEGISRDVALELKAWYRERAVAWWHSTTAQDAVCDDGGEPLQPGSGFLRPGGGLCCEAHTDWLLCNADWPKALKDIQGYFGPGLPESITALGSSAPPS
jgi:hypothetical protein